MAGGGACMAGGWVGGNGGGHAWQGACLVGGMCGGGHAWHTCPPPGQILLDTVNEWTVRILLECILVRFHIYFYANVMNVMLFNSATYR